MKTLRTKQIDHRPGPRLFTEWWIHETYLDGAVKALKMKQTWEPQHIEGGSELMPEPNQTAFLLKQKCQHQRSP